MKQKGFLLFSSLGLFVSLVAAQQTPALQKHALGVRISSQDAVVNHSITYKYRFTPSVAVETLFSFGDPVALGFLVEKHKSFGPTGLAWFWGAGAYAGFSGNRRFGAQGAVGLDYIVPSLPLNLSVDWKPELNATKVFSFEPAAVGFSARFVF